MINNIPERINFFDFAKKGLILSKKYKIKDFPRIKKIATNIDDAVNIELNFNLENSNIPCIQGKINVNLKIMCQRCLCDMEVNLKPSFKLAFLRNEKQGIEIDKSFEKVINTDDEINTIDFLTGEILIDIPMIAKHNYECYKYIDKKLIKESNKSNPFTILEKLKK